MYLVTKYIDRELVVLSERHSSIIAEKEAIRLGAFVQFQPRGSVTAIRQLQVVARPSYLRFA